MSENLLGKSVAPAKQYAPELLFGIPRHQARVELGLGEDLPFLGEDVWHAWELSWLNSQGVPQSAVGRFHFPCELPNLVESKSFKLYLNSLNNHSFASVDELRGTVEADLSKIAGGQVGLDVLGLDDATLMPTELQGVCIDQFAVSEPSSEPSHSLLRPRAGEGGSWYSHLLRSLCPVTAQPDWATVVVSLVGVEVDEASLLSYILGFRNHQEFHEQCVERMFCDLNSVLSPAQLSVQALYVRRGGLDISPWRSTQAAQAPGLRSIRQ